MKAALPDNETARLAALYACQILDTDPEQVYDALTRLAAFVCRTPMAAVSLVDADRQWFKSLLGLDLRETARDIAFCAHTILQSDVLTVPDTTQDVRFADNPLVTSAPRIRFYAGAPLVTTDGHALGDLCVADHAPRQITLDQKNTLRALARQATRHLERTSQARGAPFWEPDETTFAGLDAAFHCESATIGQAVGGDFLDVYALSAGKVALVVGDVMGKGLGAAAEIFGIKSALRAFLHEDGQPDAALTGLNDFLCKQDRQAESVSARDETTRFVCLSLAVIDTVTGKVQVSVAGADPPLIVRASGRVEKMRVTGLPLRIQQDAEYVVRQRSLSPGDLLVMATDGVTEARHPERRQIFFGTAGLVQAIQAARVPPPSLPDLVAAVVGQVRQFAGGRLSDDLCLLLAQRRPEAGA